MVEADNLEGGLGGETQPVAAAVGHGRINVMARQLPGNQPADTGIIVDIENMGS